MPPSMRYSAPVMLFGDAVKAIRRATSRGEIDGHGDRCGLRQRRRNGAGAGHDAHALGEQGAHGGEADALAAARDDGGLARQFQFHVVLPVEVAARMGGLDKTSRQGGRFGQAAEIRPQGFGRGWNSGPSRTRRSDSSSAAREWTRWLRGCRCRSKNDVSVGRLPAAVEATAYFVVAEALTNVTKRTRAEHARSRRASRTAPSGGTFVAADIPVPG
jgi:hypothetical protein